MADLYDQKGVMTQQHLIEKLPESEFFTILSTFLEFLKT